MERKDAIIALEDDLQDIGWMLQKASHLLQTVAQDCFCHCEMPASAAALAQLRGGYSRNRAKAELARALIEEADHSICSLLMQ